MTKEVSIIIATHNRCQNLRAVLNDLMQIRIDGLSYEIIIVDNNSNDQTKEVVQEFQGKLPEKIVYLLEPRQGKSFALNHAIAHANGEILAFTDDDIKIDPDWLVNLRECFIKYSCDGVGGRVLPLYDADTPQWIKDNGHQLFGPVVQYDFGMEDIPYNRSQIREFIGANFAFKKSVLTECGGFRVDIGPGQGFIGEDTEIIDRLNKLNKRLYYCGNALIWHPVIKDRTKLKYIAEWFIQIGRFRVRSGTFDQGPLVCWGGVPRYLFRTMFKDMFNMLFNILDRGTFLKHFLLFFIKIGAVKEYHLLYLTSKKKKAG